MAVESEIDRLFRALKAADETGDEEGAKKLAAEIRKSRAAAVGTFRRGLAGVNIGISQFIGFPVDLVSAMLGAFGLDRIPTIPDTEKVETALTTAGFRLYEPFCCSRSI